MPPTIEQSIAAPIETQVNGVPNMIYMDSRSSNDGSYTLNVTFEVGTAQDIAAVDVQNQVAIAQRQLPADVLRQGVSITKRQPQPLIFIAIEATDPRYDYLFLSNFATLQVYDALARVPGVGQVQQYRCARLRHANLARPGKMSRLGITTGDITNVISEQNVVAPAGVVGAEPAPPGQADDLHGHGAWAAAQRAGIRERGPESRPEWLGACGCATSRVSSWQPPITHARAD